MWQCPWNSPAQSCTPMRAKRKKVQKRRSMTQTRLGMAEPRLTRITRISLMELRVRSGRRTRNVRSAEMPGMFGAYESHLAQAERVATVARSSASEWGACAGGGGEEEVEE